MLILLLASACGGTNNENITNSTDMEAAYVDATADELAGIRKALVLYVEAVVKGDSKIVHLLLPRPLQFPLPRMILWCHLPSRHFLTITTMNDPRRTAMKLLCAKLPVMKLS